MTNITMGLGKTKEEILVFKVSDEALEIAAGSAKDKATLPSGLAPVCLSVRADRLIAPGWISERPPQGGLSVYPV